MPCNDGLGNWDWVRVKYRVAPPPKTKLWFNIYPGESTRLAIGYGFASKEEADRYDYYERIRIACIELEVPLP